MIVDDLFKRVNENDELFTHLKKQFPQLRQRTRAQRDADRDQQLADRDAQAQAHKDALKNAPPKEPTKTMSHDDSVVAFNDKMRAKGGRFTNMGDSIEPKHRMVGEADTQGSAVVPGGAINPDTKRPYTYAELRAKYAEPEVDASAAVAEPAAVAPAGETPEQTRIRKQKAAIQSIDNPAEPSQPAPSANPFGAMAGQLGAYAPPETTNTGGTLKQTPTGQVHTSSATNPNAQTNPAPAVPQAVAPPPNLGKQSDGKDIKPGQKFDTATGQPLASGATTPASTTAADTTTTAPAIARVGAPAGKQAVDQAVATVKSVRSDRRPQVINYGKQQFDTLAQKPVAPVVAPAVEPTATQQPLPQYTTKLSPDATVSTTPPASTGGTYDKRTGQAKVGNVGQTRLTDLPPEVQQRIQQQLSPVAEALIRPVTELLQQAESKEDIQRIKQFVDQQFVKHGAVSESAFAQRNQLINYIKEHSHTMAR